MNKSYEKNLEPVAPILDRVSFQKSVLILVAAVLIACFSAWAGYVRYSPPPPKPATVSDDEFSAERASIILEDLVGDGIPHPSGSEQIAVVRKRIIDYLNGLGIDVEQHETSNKYWKTGESVPLVNLIARIPGTSSSGVIALASHYDTKFSTPGASDDGVAVAASLEIARYFSKNPPKNDLVLLLTDGEELGLLGAEMFMKEHSLAKEIDVIINLEARGTSGPSLMFETGTASQWSIQQFSATADRPFTSSLFFEIYKLLPNDTDFSRFREGDLQGFNFAFIGDVKNYHTPHDNFENVDRGSFQHHGDNAMELMKRLAQQSNLKIPEGRAVYFDFLGFRIFHWPQTSAIPLAVFPLLLFIFMGVVRQRNNRTIKQLLLAMVLVAAYLIAAVVVGYVLDVGMTFDGQFENPWPFNPVPRELSFWLVTASLAGLFGFITRHFEPRKIFVATWLIWCLILFLISIIAAGASYLFLIPCLFAVIGLLVWRASPIVGALLGWLGVCLIWLPMEPLFYDALGFRLNLFLVVRVALVSTALIPIIAIVDRKAGFVFSSVSGAAAVVCLLIGKFGF